MISVIETNGALLQQHPPAPQKKNKRSQMHFIDAHTRYSYMTVSCQSLLEQSMLLLTFKWKIRAWNLKEKKKKNHNSAELCLFVCICLWSSHAPMTLKFVNTQMPPQTFTHTHTHAHVCSRYTFPPVIFSVSRETSSLSCYTSRKWIFNPPVPPGGCLRKGFNWFQTNNDERHFLAKSFLYLFYLI